MAGYVFSRPVVTGPEEGRHGQYSLLPREGGARPSTRTARRGRAPGAGPDGQARRASPGHERPGGGAHAAHHGRPSRRVPGADAPAPFTGRGRLRRARGRLAPRRQQPGTVARQHGTASGAGREGRLTGGPQVHTPDEPRRWLPTRCVSTIPIASIRANIVVGPTNAKPRRFSSRDSATDSGELVGTSERRRGAGVAAGWNDHTSATSPPSARSATVARAFTMVASTFRRFLTMPGSAISRSTSAGPKGAAVSGSKPAKARQNASPCSRIVAPDRPDWNASSERRSKRPRSSRTGMPHSVS